MNKEESSLSRLFAEWSGEKPERFIPLPGSGSYRSYCRIVLGSKTVMGVCNDDVRENQAFLSFTRAFHDAGFPVPAILAEDRDRQAYLLQDLGDVTLFQLLDEERRTSGDFSRGMEEIYRDVIRWLIRFQVEGSTLVDFSLCYPRAAFDRQSMMWDLSYFKYYFLKLARVSFDEQKLEDDFISFTDFLLSADNDFFMYRDFQSRNIMLLEEKL